MDNQPIDNPTTGKIVEINDVVYIEPELTLWWRIKMLFGDFFHPDGYVKEEPKQHEKEQLQSGIKASEEVHQ